MDHGIDVTDSMIFGLGQDGHNLLGAVFELFKIFLCMIVALS